MAVRRGLVLSVLICVGCCAWAQSDGIEFMQGRFSESITVDFRATTLADVLSSETELDLIIVWEAMEFAPAFHLSELQSSSFQLSTRIYAGHFVINSLAAFDLVKPQSHFLQFGWGTNAFGVSYGPTFLLVHNPWDPTPQDLKMDFEFRGQTVNGMSVTLVATFGNYVDPTGGRIYPGSWPNTGDTDGVCDLPFTGAEIYIHGFQFCCAESSILISFDSGGFENIVFDVDEIRIENLPWLALSTSLTFSPETKSMTISPRLEFGAFEGCLSVRWAHSGVTTGNPPSGAVPTVESIDISGIELQCTLGEVNVSGAFDGGHDIVIDISNEPDSNLDEDCCNGLRWSIAARFTNPGGTLFGISDIVGSIALFLTPHFSWRAGLYTYLPGSLITRWMFGFDIQFGP